MLEEKVKVEGGKYLEIVPSQWSQFGKTIDINVCGFPCDKMEYEPTRLSLYEAEQESRSNYREGLI